MHSTVTAKRISKAAFTPRQHVAGNMLLVAVNKIVANLLLVCCWIQRDTMLPRYRQHVARPGVNAA